MKSIVIEGPARVSGVITPGGNKNAALPIIAASILTRDEVVIHNMPVILDVEVMLDLARDLGASVRRALDLGALHRGGGLLGGMLGWVFVLFFGVTGARRRCSDSSGKRASDAPPFAGRGSTSTRLIGLMSILRPERIR